MSAVSFATTNLHRSSHTSRSVRPVTLVGGILVDPVGFFDEQPSLDSGSAASKPSGRHAVTTAGRSPEVAPRATRRTSLLITLGLAVVFAAIVVGGEVASADSRPESVPQPQQVSVVVQPGDSLWVIARRMQPVGDVRPLVDELVARHGSAAIVPGDIVTVVVRR